MINCRWMFGLGVVDIPQMPPNMIHAPLGLKVSVPRAARIDCEEEYTRCVPGMRTMLLARCALTLFNIRFFQQGVSMTSYARTAHGPSMRRS